MPPPPPKFASATVNSTPPPKLASLTSQKDDHEPERDGLKLVEYGEDEDEPSTQTKDSTKTEKFSLYSTGKPFWAAP